MPVRFTIAIFQDTFGHLLNDTLMPSKEDFETFDENDDEMLYYEEWLESLNDY